MIPIEAVLARLSGLDAPMLESWIAREWVRPARQAGHLVFDEIDVARCRLILELRDELEVNDAAIPVVLQLLDQLHLTRRQLRRVAEALVEIR
ncbi:chaperone modulator CbpM [Muricoccus radiodurans]|uniref:chaperone modulator CbpM n=1 Tax=Muricoccus radiodurans TaxID=2231721 RepID=UPI003CEC0460